MEGKARRARLRGAGVTSPAALAALAVGFALHNAWICAAMYSPAVMGATVLLPGLLQSSYSLVYLVSAIANAALALTAAFLDERLEGHSCSRPSMLLGAILACLGSALLLLPVASVAPVAMNVVAGVLTGVGSATLMLFWGIGLSRQRGHVSAVLVPVCVVAGYALAVLLRSLPSPAGGVVTAAIPLVEFAMLALASPHQSDELVPMFSTLQTSRPRFASRLLEATLCVGIALGILKQVAVQSSFGDLGGPSTTVALLLAGALAVAVFLFYALLRKIDSWDALFTTVCPAVASAMLAVVLVVYDEHLLANVLLVTTYFLYEALLWLHPTLLARRFRLSPIFLFGIIRGTATVAMFVGAAAALYGASLADQLGDSRLFIIVLIVLILLARAAMPKGAEILRNIVRCPAVRIASLQMDDRLELAEAAAAQGIPPVERPRPGPASLLDAHAQQPEGEHAKGGHFSRRVRKVADTFLLTERETDILFELAKGNGANYIQEKLCISAGTVKTHIRNIYRKLSVHSRNDLLRLIESMEED